MIDETNARIGEMEEGIRRQNERRYAFYRMLQSTDRVLWKLEEMNRDGVKEIPRPVREEAREALSELPAKVRDAFCDSPAVQEALDSIFEVQERLFEWRNPSWADQNDENFEQAS